jgi:hypothetical protein
MDPPPGTPTAAMRVQVSNEAHLGELIAFLERAGYRSQRVGADEILVSPTRPRSASTCFVLTSTSSCAPGKPRTPRQARDKVRITEGPGGEPNARALQRDPALPTLTVNLRHMGGCPPR